MNTSSPEYKFVIIILLKSNKLNHLMFLKITFLNWNITMLLSANYLLEMCYINM